LAKTEEQTFKLSAQWNISQSAKTLVISGGADATFEIELDDEKSSFFSRTKNSQPFTRRTLSAQDQRILEELVTAEIVVPVIEPRKQLKISIINDGNYVFAGNKIIKIVGPSESPDLAIVVRTSSSYRDFVNLIDYPSISIPHLFVDTAFHHTLSIGPLVFPGETACVACLQGRITKRWGDNKPPIKAKAGKSYGRLIAELVIVELERIAAGDTTLVNKTCVWNFQDRSIKINQLLKVPLCPICTKNSIDHNGAIALPW
jgi:bacteriocin biosynthesis cyclodehydratase domain-containing protein